MAPHDRRSNTGGGEGGLAWDAGAPPADDTVPLAVNTRPAPALRSDMELRAETGDLAGEGAIARVGSVGGG